MKIPRKLEDRLSNFKNCRVSRNAPKIFATCEGTGLSEVHAFILCVITLPYAKRHRPYYDVINQQIRYHEQVRNYIFLLHSNVKDKSCPYYLKINPQKVVKEKHLKSKVKMTSWQDYQRT